MFFNVKGTFLVHWQAEPFSIGRFRIGIVLWGSLSVIC